MDLSNDCLIKIMGILQEHIAAQNEMITRLMGELEKARNPVVTWVNPNPTYPTYKVTCDGTDVTPVGAGGSGTTTTGPLISVPYLYNSGD